MAHREGSGEEQEHEDDDDSGTHFLQCREIPKTNRCTDRFVM